MLQEQSLFRLFSFSRRIFTLYYGNNNLKGSYKMKRKRKIYTPESGMKGVISIIKQAGLQIKSIEYLLFIEQDDEAVYAIGVIATKKEFEELQTEISYNQPKEV